MKKLMFLMLSLAAFAASSCKKENPVTPPDTTVHVTGVSLGKKTLTLTLGLIETETLAAAVAPGNATDNAVTWKSDKPGVAAVDQNGKVTAVGEGEAVITVETADGGFKDSCTVTVDPQPAVFVSGYYSDMQNGRDVACFWADGRRIDLTVPAGSRDGYGNSIAVSGGKVYVGGEYWKDDGTVITPCYWVNGQRTDMPFPDGVNDARVFSIAVSGGAVYASGTYGKNSKWYPCYWSGGKCFTLAVPAPGYDINGCRAASIAVSEGKVYVAGTVEGTAVAYYASLWTEEGRSDLISPPDTHCRTFGNSMAVSGGKVYVAGHYSGEGKDYACLWCDGECADLAPPAGMFDSVANSVAISADGKVYVAGFCRKSGESFACLWTDGAAASLSRITGAIIADGNSVAVSADGKVYVAGYCMYSGGDSDACLWTDGVRAELDIPEGDIGSHATSVALRQ